MENGPSNSHLVFADAMIFAVVLRTNFRYIQSHRGFISEIESGAAYKRHLKKNFHELKMLEVARESEEGQVL